MNLELSKYARIGKAPLIKAIGVQENHKETYYTESQELDRTASGCFACPNYKNIDFYEYMPAEIQKEACNNCKNCPHAVYKTITHEHVKYINERNMYGNAPRLKAIALKLLVIYHFSCPDERGFVRSLSPKELASYLGCTVRSIKNANRKLENYGYIMYCNDGSKNRFHVILSEYTTYALSAKEGGRGYATFNRCFLDELVKLQDLNQLRVFLRAALDMDTNRNPKRELIQENQYSFLRSFLPRYCKPNIIKKALSAASNLFQVAFGEDVIALKMNPECHGRRDFEKNNKENTDIIKKYIEKLDSVMKHANAAIMKKQPVTEDDLDALKQAGIQSRAGSLRKLYVPFNLTDDDLKDLGCLGSTYSVESVLECVGYVYEQYQSKFKMSSIGALIRTILKENNSQTELFYAFS